MQIGVRSQSLQFNMRILYTECLDSAVSGRGSSILLSLHNSINSWNQLTQSSALKAPLLVENRTKSLDVMAAMQCKFAPLLAGIMTDDLVPIFDLPSRRLQYKLELVSSVQIKVRPDDFLFFWLYSPHYSCLRPMGAHFFTEINSPSSQFLTVLIDTWKSISVLIFCLISDNVAREFDWGSHPVSRIHTYGIEQSINQSRWPDFYKYTRLPVTRLSN